MDKNDLLKQIELRDDLLRRHQELIRLNEQLARGYRGMVESYEDSLMNCMLYIVIFCGCMFVMDLAIAYGDDFRDYTRLGSMFLDGGLTAFAASIRWKMIRTINEGRDE